MVSFSQDWFRRVDFDKIRLGHVGMNIALVGMQQHWELCNHKDSGRGQSDKSLVPIRTLNQKILKLRTLSQGIVNLAIFW